MPHLPGGAGWQQLERARRQGSETHPENRLREPSVLVPNRTRVVNVTAFPSKAQMADMSRNQGHGTFSEIPGQRFRGANLGSM